MTDECGKMSCLGSVCIKPAGHDGDHRSAYDAVWSEESDRASAERISRSMDGRRD